MSPDWESDLIRRSAAGDTRAFRELVEHHQSFAFAVAYRFTGHPDDARDVAQEAFIKLWNNLKRYRKEIKLSTWLYTIIMNQAFDHLKSAHHRAARQTEDVQVSAAQSDPAEQDRVELLDVIARLASTLTPKQQSVFVLRDLEGLDSQEVETITGMDASQIKSNLYYARLTLREKLEKYYQEAKTTPS
jgi:RNA polymerase sigma-70 factor (ECF subfamily)